METKYLEVLEDIYENQRDFFGTAASHLHRANFHGVSPEEIVGDALTRFIEILETPKKIKKVPETKLEWRKYFGGFVRLQTRMYISEKIDENWFSHLSEDEKTMGLVPPSAFYHNEFAKKWQKDNPERVKLYRTTSPVYAKNHRKAVKKFQLKHPKKVAEYKRRWAQKNREKVNLYKRNYRQRMKLASQLNPTTADVIGEPIK